jgi:hypothetical protein
LERRYSSYSLSTTALDEGEWSASRPGPALAPAKGPLLSILFDVNILPYFQLSSTRPHFFIEAVVSESWWHGFYSLDVFKTGYRFKITNHVGRCDAFDMKEIINHTICNLMIMIMSMG